MHIEERKLQAQHIANLYKQIGYERYYKRINECARYLKYVEKVPHYFEIDYQSGSIELCEKDAEFRLVEGVFCRVRHCPICQWRKTKRWQAIALRNLPIIKRELPKHRWLFLTLTVKNCKFEFLKETIEHLNKSFRKLVKFKSFPAEGWIKSLEVTINQKTNTVHPHFHVMLLVPPKYFNSSLIYMNQEDWKTAWKKAAKLDYEPMVNVKAIKLNQEDKHVAEALKYTVKPDHLFKINKEQLLKLTTQLNGIHAINKGGILREYLRNVGKEDIDYVGNLYDSARSTGMEMTKQFYSQFNGYEYVVRTKSGELCRGYFELSEF